MKKFFLLSILHLSFFLLSACSSTTPPNLTPTLAPAGSVLFQDEFDNPSTGWDQISNDNGVMNYNSGGYRLLVNKPTLNLWSTPEVNLRDVRIETDVVRLGGPAENRMGVMCRYQNGNYYFFVISNDGYYAIGKFINGVTTLLGQELMQTSEYIQSGGVNHLRADCIGDTLTFYINYNLIAGASDSELTSGDIGVLAGSFADPGVDVMFDHYVVLQP